MSDLHDDCADLIRDAIQSWLFDELDWWYEADPPYDHDLDDMLTEIEKIQLSII